MFEKFVDAFEKSSVNFDYVFQCCERLLMAYLNRLTGMSNSEIWRMASCTLSAESRPRELIAHSLRAKRAGSRSGKVIDNHHILMKMKNVNILENIVMSLAKK